MRAFNQIFNLYQQWLTQDTLYSANTIAHYQRITENFLNYLESFKIRRLNDVDAELVTQFAYYNGQKKRYAPVFINVRLAALNCFFSWTYEQGFSRENPVLNYKKLQIKPKPLAKQEGKLISPVPVILNYSQQELLYNHPLENDFIAIRNKCIALLILSTALFAEEVITLPPKALNFSNRRIELKGDVPRPREIPMDLQCYKTCKKWLAVRQQALGNAAFPLLFFTQHLTPLTRRSLYQLIANYIAAAGVYLKRNGPEVLRQTAICNMLNDYMIDDVKAFTSISFQQLEQYKATIVQKGLCLPESGRLN